MIVGDDDARRVDDEAGAERLDALRRAVGTVAALVAEKLVEEVGGTARRWGVSFGDDWSSGSGAPRVPAMVCSVEMLTTASISGATRSATESGPPPFLA